ncbi:MAG: class I SAM-dependent methyltransferase [Armatimonadota bacterium]|nr:class I SAM-dependent methyltransferase [Armatimonadota bacterium]
MRIVERKQPCAACEAEQAVYVKPLVEKDGAGNGHIVRCPKCALVSVDPMPPLEANDLQDVYDEAYYSEYGGFQCIGNPVADRIMLAACDRQLAMFEQYVDKGIMLDFGCADGKFLKAAQLRGWDAYGLDISSYAVDCAKAAGLKAFCGIIDDLPIEDGSVNLVIMSHVIEHIGDSTDVLRDIRRKLKEGGLLVVETENSRSLRRAIELAVIWIASQLVKPLGTRFRTRGKQRYHRLHPPVHVHTYGRKSLEALLSRVGFEVVHVTCPGMGNPCFCVTVPGKRKSLFENVLQRVDSLGGHLGIGEVIVVLARAIEQPSSAVLDKGHSSDA